MKLVFATHNMNKYAEVKLLMPKNIELYSLNMIGCKDEIPETGNTLEENAQIKADFVTKNYGFPCFSDDTGLLVDALNGAPGVHTARYAGEQKNTEDNMNKLLKNLKLGQSRSAHFKTVIALNTSATNHIFKGLIEGRISEKKQGTKGFGYDPIFIPDGYNQTFAELALEVKNTISHRGIAIKQLINYLSKL